MISRRNFVRGLVAVVAAPAIVPHASLMPIRGLIIPAIYGNAIYDDTAGLQALVNGSPFLDLTDGAIHKMGDTLLVHRGVFRLTKTILFPNNGPNVHILGSTFDSSADLVLLFLPDPRLNVALPPPPASVS